MLRSVFPTYSHLKLTPFTKKDPFALCFLKVDMSGMASSCCDEDANSQQAVRRSYAAQRRQATYSPVVKRQRKGASLLARLDHRRAPAGRRCPLLERHLRCFYEVSGRSDAHKEENRSQEGLEEHAGLWVGVERRGEELATLREEVGVGCGGKGGPRVVCAEGR